MGKLEEQGHPEKKSIETSGGRVRNSTKARVKRKRAVSEVLLGVEIGRSRKRNNLSVDPERGVVRRAAKKSEKRRIAQSKKKGKKIKEIPAKDRLSSAYS